MKRRGFTLVELLIVIGIIAGLAAIVLSVFSHAREGGRKTTCQSNQKQILAALSMYLQDSDGRFPLGIQVTSVSPLDIGTWFDSLLPYTKDQRVFQCPSDNTLIAETWPSFPVSYSANNTNLMLSGQTGHGARPPLHLSQVRSPSTTVFISDAATQTSLTPPYVTTSSTEKENCWYLLAPDDSPSLGIATDNPDSTVGGPSLRHSGMSNVGFIDGHVKAMHSQQWYYLDTPWLDPKRGGDAKEG
jgi:prepilin-type N-terminal cleavage/methylation domain-containing protein/prepilin-type processing-associated H-X9-DG protein